MPAPRATYPNSCAFLPQRTHTPHSSLVESILRLYVSLMIWPRVQVCADLWGKTVPVTTTLRGQGRGSFRASAMLTL